MGAVQRNDPLISICVPTHDGRGKVLSELVESVIDQARDVPGLVELCVSDNASQDETAIFFADLPESRACPLVYRRQSEDVGLARNLLTAVALAHGRYCWLLGSDDLLVPGALRRACELLNELPDATGYVVGAIHVDAEDANLRSRALPAAFHPHGQTRLIEGIGRVLDECGNAWCALSWTLVDRETWLRVARRRAKMVLEHPVFPQIVVLAAMAEERPLWGWLAEPLVYQRNATTFLFERGDSSLAERWTQIIDGAAAAWGAALGRRGGRSWRRRMRRLNRVWGSAADARATKLYASPPPVGSQARLALACLAAFWPARGYWREVLPATLMPAWLTRARYGFGTGRAAGRRSVASAKLTISGLLPSRMAAGSVESVEVEARNDGNRAILPEGPRGVTVGQRWLTAESRPLGREELRLNKLAALPQPVPRAVRAGRAIQADLTLYAPVEPGLYRVEVVAHQHGRGWLDELGESPVLAGLVEVVGQQTTPGAPAG